MASDDSMVPFRFELKWLVGPLLIILVAGLLVLFFPVPTEPAPVSSEAPPQPDLVQPTVDVAAAKVAALAQCELEYDCSQQDCLEKVLTHIDSASTEIDAVLRTPAPREFRDHLRLAIKRGVTVKLVLDSTLNPKFFLEGANIRVKTISKFVATNFVIIDRDVVVYGSDPNVYAMEPDVINVACTEKEKNPYILLFDRVWSGESSSFNSETDQEEILSDDELVASTEQSSCSADACGPDTFTCDGTTKVYQDYFCESSCVYQIIPLYYSAECGYSNPGFDPDGNPLVVISEIEVDEGQLAQEFIQFTSLQPLELSNFSLLKDGVLLTTFPTPYLLDGSAKVFTGSGVGSNTVVYLDQNNPIWKTPGTTATLVNPDGLVVATQTFEG